MGIVHVTDENFEQEVLQNKEIILIDFYATWCGPCKALAPILEEVVAEDPSIKVCKVDVDKAPSLAKQFRIMSVPTLVVMEAGNIVERMSGLQSKEDIMEMVK